MEGTIRSKQPVHWHMAHALAYGLCFGSSVCGYVCPSVSSVCCLVPELRLLSLLPLVPLEADHTKTPVFHLGPSEF